MNGLKPLNNENQHQNIYSNQPLITSKHINSEITTIHSY